MTSQYSLYAGSYASASEPGIYMLTFDSATRNLSINWSFTEIVNPSFIVVHPNKNWLYAVSETSPHQEGKSGEIWALALSDTHTPHSLNHQASGGDWPCHLAIDGTGRWIIVSNYASGSAAVFPLRDDGSLGEMSALVQHYGHGPHAQRQEGPHVHSVTFTPDNRFVLIADLGLDQLAIYRFDAEQGQLRPHAQFNTQPGSGPRHLAFHQSGRYLYAAQELSNTVAVYDYEAAQGKLSEKQVIETLPPDAPENTVADIHLTPDGERLYVSNRGHNSLAIFSIAADGRLQHLANETCGGSWPRNFAFAPGGQFLFVANQFSNELAVLSVNAWTSYSGQQYARAFIPGVSCVQFRP